MIIDAIFLLLLALALFKGLRKGLVVALFSFIAFMAGLAAALKLSSVVAARLSEHTGSGARWLPLVSFILVFIAVALLVSLLGRLIQKSFEAVMLGWANRIAGALFYLLLYCIFYSIFLFYAVQLHLISDETIKASLSYAYLQPLAPFIMDRLGSIIPFFKNMFYQLQQFFENGARKMP
jgi:membrane protein required for colicin V production